MSLDVNVVMCLRERCILMTQLSLCLKIHKHGFRASKQRLFSTAESCVCNGVESVVYSITGWYRV